MNRQQMHEINRRELLRLGLFAGGAALLGGPLQLFSPTQAHASLPPDFGCGVMGEPVPMSPLCLDPWTAELPIPKALAPIPDSEVNDPTKWPNPPGSGPGQQSSDGYGTHQLWTTKPNVYRIKLQVAEHKVHSKSVQRLLKVFDTNGNVVGATAGEIVSSIPASTIYGFNGSFPGPMINAEYGKPNVVRFVNELDQDHGLDRNDFGAPDWAFLTHLHNGHTACESDGNPHYRPDAYQPGQWCDNLYLNMPPQEDPAEKQSFFWFHDHRMDHTGANVYKGMVGLYPIYDPVLDSGDETKGLRLPGVRKNNSDGSFDVKYDIPLAFYDCRLDDGVTPHSDFHNGCGETHPEWWGQTFFRHYPNHGFVGDVFTVNGVTCPVLHVERRKYRFRFLDASIARIYNFKLMQGSIEAAPGQQGQYNFKRITTTTRTRGGGTVTTTTIDAQQCMKFTQIATDGGLLPMPIVRDQFELWPAKRREFILDFSKYMDGSPTTKGDVIYLVNTMKMVNGRKPNTEPTFVNDAGATVPDPDFDPSYAVPMIKIVIGDLPSQPDMSVVPKTLRPLPALPKTLKGLPERTFTLQRGGAAGGEAEWLINGNVFDPTVSLANVKRGSGELWTIKNGGGGWVHPMHLHMEEHRVITRNGVAAPDKNHPDDGSREDVIALGPGESVQIYRKFRTFVGEYVAHCHNLAHEDHAMMFGWKIIP